MSTLDEIYKFRHHFHATYLEDVLNDARAMMIGFSDEDELGAREAIVHSIAIFNLAGMSVEEAARRLCTVIRSLQMSQRIGGDV